MMATWADYKKAGPLLISTRSPGHGGRQAGANFLFRCGRQADGIRQLGECAIEKACAALVSRNHQRDGRPHLHIGLHNGERLIDIGNDVVRVLDADRQSDVSLSDAGLKLLFR